MSTAAITRRLTEAAELLSVALATSFRKVQYE
jgi:hypothetical protein